MPPLPQAPLEPLKTMREPIDPYWWTFALTSLVQFFLFLRWLYRRIRNDEITRTFVEDMATNHLPHIYALLKDCVTRRESRPRRVRRFAGLI